MQSKKLAGNKISSTTQSFLDIAQIRNDVVILKDGTLRTVLLVSSINFALKSEDEQNAIISGYVGFMNSFDFSIQIIIQSRKLNIESYLNNLQKREKELTNDLLRMQIADYRQYVTELVEIGDIMTKNFYIVVPYSPLTDKRKSFFSRITELFNPGSLVRLKEETFQKYRGSLMQRVEHIKMGLGSMGLESVVLDTQSLIELYYNMYNPDIYETVKMEDVNKIQLENQ